MFFFYFLVFSAFSNDQGQVLDYVCIKKDSSFLSTNGIGAYFFAQIIIPSTKIITYSMVFIILITSSSFCALEISTFPIKDTVSLIVVICLCFRLQKTCRVSFIIHASQLY